MRLYLLVIVNFFLLTSCKKYKPADSAFFIRANPVQVATTPGTQGQGTQKITDLYLYVSGKFQGAYPVGSLMPVITKDQKVTIDLFAGIKNNGISETRVSWIFYKRITMDTLVENGKTIERGFTFNYDPNVTFAWLEDFDSNTGYSIKRSAASDVNFKIAPASESLKGRSLLMELTGDSIQAQIETNIAYTLPTGSANVYLELDYKCSAPFKVGVISDAELKEALVVTPQANWNKIYIQLAGVINTSPVTSTCKVYFRMLKTADYPNPKLYLDNIKLIHF